jgi:hypothetical protein
MPPVDSKRQREDADLEVPRLGELGRLEGCLAGSLEEPHQLADGRAETSVWTAAAAVKMPAERRASKPLRAP